MTSCFTLSGPIFSRTMPGNTPVLVGTLGSGNYYLAVAELLPEGWAASNRAIHVGDRIVAVAQEDGEDVRVKGWKITEVVRLIRGPKGTAVRLTIVPAGKDES